jgi:hypothetical protein
MYKLISHSIVEEHFDSKPYNYPIAINRQKENEEDVIKVNVPLMIRLLEYSREDAKSDVDLHFVVEKLIELSEHGECLTMEHYSKIVPHETHAEIPTEMME